MSALFARHRTRAALLAASVLVIAAPAAQAATTPEDIDAVPRLRAQLEQQAETAPVASAAGDGFEWGDAGVGAAAALVLAGAAAGGGIAASRLRRGQRPSHGLG